MASKCGVSVGKFMRKVLSRIIVTLLMAVMAIGNPSVLFAAGSVESEGEHTFSFPELCAPANAPLRGGGASAEKQIRETPVSSSGSYSTGISIDMPPGRLGMTPAVGLSYDSSAYRQDSVVEAGWSFSIPQIRRYTGDGTPSINTSENTGISSYLEPGIFESTTTGKLLPAPSKLAPDNASGMVYVAELDSGRVRYEFLSAAQANIDGGMWIEHLPDGRKRYYGGIPGNPGERRAQIVNELGTFSYLLVMEKDVYSNYITYSYHNIDSQERVNQNRVQIMPVIASIEWGGNLSEKYAAYLLTKHNN